MTNHIYLEHDGDDFVSDIDGRSSLLILSFPILEIIDRTTSFIFVLLKIVKVEENLY